MPLIVGLYAAYLNATSYIVWYWIVSTRHTIQYLVACVVFCYGIFDLTLLTLSLATSAFYASGVPTLRVTMLQLAYP